MAIMDQLGVMTGTADRGTALRYIRSAYPLECRPLIADTHECAGPLLDFVSDGTILMRDPLLDGPGARRIGYMAGPSWLPQRAAQVQEAAMRVHKLVNDAMIADARKRATLEDERILAAIAKRDRKNAKRVGRHG